MKKQKVENEPEIFARAKKYPNSKKTTIGRRYRIGEHDLYDGFYQIKKSGSPILRPLEAGVMQAIDLSSLSSLKNEKALLQGCSFLANEGSEGYYEDSEGGLFRAKIPAIEADLKALNEEWKNYRQQQINSGFHAPEKMTPEMLNKRLKWEAELDVAQEEIAKINDLMLVIIEEQKAVKRKKMLNLAGHRGLGSWRSNWDGVVIEIDGQNVSITKSGVLAINEPSSPYNGLLVADYRLHIVTPWLKADAALSNEISEHNMALELKGLQDGKRNYLQEKLSTLPPRPEGLKCYANEL